MQSLFEVGQAGDRNLNLAIAKHCDSPEWSKKDIQNAKDSLYDDIMNGAQWDEELENYRRDMLLEMEAIMLDRDDDKLGRMRDVMNEKIRAHCDYELNHDVNKYCELYCESEY
jgi:hypothetical protein